MLWITQSLKTHCPTKIKLLIQACMSQNPVSWSLFNCSIFLLHSTRNEWRAWKKRWGKTNNIGSHCDITWLKMLCAQRMLSVEQIREASWEHLQRIQEFPAPTVWKQEFQGVCILRAQHSVLQSLSCSQRQLKGIKFLVQFSWHKLHKILWLLCWQSDFKNTKKGSLQNRLHLVNH